MFIKGKEKAETFSFGFSSDQIRGWCYIDTQEIGDQGKNLTSQLKEHLVIEFGP